MAAIGLPRVRCVASLAGTEHRRNEIIAVLEPQGALAIIDDPAVFDVAPFRPKSLSVHWEGIFTRSLHGTADVAEQGRILGDVTSLAYRGMVQTTARGDYGRINASNLRRAHAVLETGRSIGKIVLSGF